MDALLAAVLLPAMAAATTVAPQQHQAAVAQDEIGVLQES